MLALQSVAWRVRPHKHTRSAHDGDEMVHYGFTPIQAEADAATLSKEIAGLDEDISVWEGDKKASTEARCACTAELTDV